MIKIDNKLNLFYNQHKKVFILTGILIIFLVAIIVCGIISVERYEDESFPEIKGYRVKFSYKPNTSEVIKNSWVSLKVSQK